ncbi:MAG: histidine--tRNA ligase [Candidatus Dojkabacteria bacterium]|jgi:histidyl-tRNA synthetase|nr:histidine--tRNA ligase [Candidatus Dojkabacteria bacterium]
MNNKKLNTQPYKGTVDTYPADMIKRNYLFNIWRRVAKSYGYEEYDTPLLEDANLYRVKSGEEIANNQLFSFTDKGDREVALRPEMTPSLARIIAAKKNELTLPIRWFNIGPFYRYEKPQKGRNREFFQLNIDLFGIPTVEAEIEIIQFVMSVMKELKAPLNTFELKISNRYLLEYLFDNILKLEQEKRALVTKAIDNYLKIPKDIFEEYLKEIKLSDTQIDRLVEFLNWDIKDLEKISEDSKGAKELLTLFNLANELSITNISFAPYVVRGLAYYTGTVIEMFDIGSKENPRALFGGGRYDDLLEIFDEGKLPAFGLGWGDVTTLDYLNTYNLLPESKTDINIFVTLMDSKLYKETLLLTQYLRSLGINTQMQLIATKLSKQLKYANKKAIPWVVVMGEEEISSGLIQLKNMNTKESFQIKKEDVIGRIG